MDAKCTSKDDKSHSKSALLTFQKSFVKTQYRMLPLSQYVRSVDPFKSKYIGNPLYLIGPYLLSVDH